MNPNPTPGPVTTGRRLVRCGKCGHNVECTSADLLNYTRSGWPRCCGDVMTYFVEAEPPAVDTKAHRLPTDDTKVNRLPPK